MNESSRISRWSEVGIYKRIKIKKSRLPFHHRIFFIKGQGHFDGCGRKTLKQLFWTENRARRLNCFVFRIKTRFYGLLTSKWLQMTSKDLWWLPETSEVFFQEHGHVAYQMKAFHQENSLKVKKWHLEVIRGQLEVEILQKWPTAKYITVHFCGRVCLAL